jgi:alkylation response protein AidB-like acyl-CoA dehydrogenase
MEVQGVIDRAPSADQAGKAAESSASTAARPDLGTQLRDLSQVLEASLATGSLAPYYTALRASDIPLIPIAYQHDAREMYRLCCDVVHTIGSSSPAVALTIENHYFALATLATLPGFDAPEQLARRRQILDAVARDRLLIANSNSRTHGEKVGSLGTFARREGEGYRVSGTASYLTMATEGDLLIFITALSEDEFAIFVSPLKGNPEIEIGPFLFPSAMIDSDTRRITFHDLHLGPENLVFSGGWDIMLGLQTYQLTWHKALVAALFLGAAARAIEESRKFLRTVKGPNGAPLAELDGMVVDVGRLVMSYRTEMAALRHIGELLGRLADGGPPAEVLPVANELASAVKGTAAQVAEDIVSAARRIIGARSFTGAHPLERLSQEVVFGHLGAGGEPQAAFERRMGRAALGERPFRF